MLEVAILPYATRQKFWVNVNACKSFFRDVGIHRRNMIRHSLNG